MSGTEHFAGRPARALLVLTALLYLQGCGDDAKRTAKVECTNSGPASRVGRACAVAEQAGAGKAKKGAKKEAIVDQAGFKSLAGRCKSNGAGVEADCERCPAMIAMEKDGKNPSEEELLACLVKKTSGQKKATDEQAGIELSAQTSMLETDGAETSVLELKRPGMSAAPMEPRHAEAQRLQVMGDIPSRPKTDKHADKHPDKQTEMQAGRVSLPVDADGVGPMMGGIHADGAAGPRVELASDLVPLRPIATLS